MTNHDVLMDLAYRLHGFLKDSRAEDTMARTAIQNYNEAISDVIDYLYRLADAPPEYKHYQRNTVRKDEEPSAIRVEVVPVLPNIPLKASPVPPPNPAEPQTLFPEPLPPIPVDCISE